MTEKRSPGRPKGTPKTGGGSRKGVPNKATAKREALIAASGLTPLDYMLSILRDENKDEAVRIDAAKAAAPYVHPKLATIQHGGDPDGVPIGHNVELSVAEKQKEALRLLDQTFGEGKE